ncbi:MAG: methyltransferase domain-containing protein [bacterium]
MSLGPAARGIVSRFACPLCRASIVESGDGLKCTGCGASFPIVDGIADLRPEDARNKPEFSDWTKHWSHSNQELFSSKFFSLYRKQVFARTVAWFVDHFFPADGVFVEAGSGTAETSMRIDKRGGKRVLVAADIIVPVLAQVHPIMDVKVGADAFRMPFGDGQVDGIWNVGVMEHFTHDLIDAMLREFHRTLAPGAPILLLWPATDSLPQKGLRLVEKFINFRKPQADHFQFHPDEISKLRSSDEGRDVLRRNGFEPVFVDGGMRSLMAFKTVVGRKPA